MSLLMLTWTDTFTLQEEDADDEDDVVTQEDLFSDKDEL